MTTLFGNICLALAALVSRELVSSSLHYKPPHGGSGGASAYPIWMLLIHIALLCLLGLATIAIARKGGFDWVSTNKFFRYLLVAGTVFSAVLTLLMSASVMESPGGESAWLVAASRLVLVAFPVILIASGFVMLNDALRNAVPVFFYKWPLAAVFGAGILCVGVVVYDQISSASEGINEPFRRYENAPAIQADRLEEIQQTDISENMLRMLELTGALYAPAVREKAAEKVRTHPSWEKELLRFMENDHALEVFSFLAWNDVPDKNLFLEPVRKGVLSVADWIRHSIQGTSPSSFYQDQYTDEVERTLRTVEKMEGMGVDYLPAVREVRAALDEPRLGNKQVYDCAEDRQVDGTQGGRCCYATFYEYFNMLLELDNIRGGYRKALLINRWTTNKLSGPNVNSFKY